MFKFFKELLDSAKEGMAEGRAELAQEAAEAAALAESTRAELAARLARASAFERFAVALAAPYRQTFAADLRDAHEAQRAPVYLMCVDIAPKELDSFEKLLARDFSVEDGDDAEATVLAMAESLALEPDESAALWIARTTHLATGAAAVGHVTAEDALEWLVPVVERAVRSYESWESYGQAFLAGERSAPGSNIVGRKLLQGVVEKLGNDEISPWRTVPWPSAGTLDALLDSRARAAEA
ncbi:DUF1266 domain-containing protein [Variovorax guangxiensis]|uniref:DUF1266 domain-containing protein n=1 Tax=Variovorax guangxiensis TaxID=1775474 RepID=A0A502E0X7_9BURK|nr:DUF1266 domain-containing protein [Variovorax guangxiensis]RZI69471.1 MAG: DUF1266 domain-containing protein [Variovorax sp.]TPG26647.1 DUF1266 domain-containing protein [Variovorax ginsengisoli]TPG30372.1 DUF1266 domain-containing protein [Variovorax guangxiensis]